MLSAVPVRFRFPLLHISVTQKSHIKIIIIIIINVIISWNACVPNRTLVCLWASSNINRCSTIHLVSTNHFILNKKKRPEDGLKTCFWRSLDTRIELPLWFWINDRLCSPQRLYDNKQRVSCELQRHDFIMPSATCPLLDTARLEASGHNGETHALLSTMKTTRSIGQREIVYNN